MPGRIRMLDAVNRTMQRLGYLKLLCELVNQTETSNLATLGRRLIDRVTRRVPLSPPFDEQVREYARTRLTDRTYQNLRKAILEGTSETVSLEIQDFYLADPTIPSSTGKLVEANWRRYPYLGTALDLVRKGTYSALTRSLVLLAVTPQEELDAFVELDRQHNPMRLSDAQALVFLYCLLDNDAEVLVPLYRRLLALPTCPFDERVAGDMLPEILRSAIQDHRKRGVTAEERERLAILAKSATSIEKKGGKAYTGGSAREEAIRVRLEPYCDLGFLAKPDRDRYEYQSTEALRMFVSQMEGASSTDAFLQERFFTAFAAARGLTTTAADDADATQALAQAGQALKSSLGYSPITDVGLLAGIRLLVEKGRVLELGRATELLKALQKQDPGFVRFTVDRMGNMAYVKFLKGAPGG